jgi:hypothetical protein
MATVHPTTSRRAFIITAAALASPLAALPALAAGTAGPHPDAALLDLGRRFDKARGKWEGHRDAYEAANDAWSAALQNLARTNGGRFDRQGAP